MNVFVYGTLREGGDLFPMLDVGRRRRALADGFTLFEFAGGAYPIMMSTPGRSVPVLGDLVTIGTFDEDSALAAFWRVHEMETAAGYACVPIRVRTCDDHVEHDALAFVWVDDDDDWIGREVPSGDWLTHRMLNVGGWSDVDES